MSTSTQNAPLDTDELSNNVEYHDEDVEDDEARDDKNEINCERCGRVFNSRRGMKIHMNTCKVIV